MSTDVVSQVITVTWFVVFIFATRTLFPVLSRFKSLVVSILKTTFHSQNYCSSLHIYEQRAHIRHAANYNSSDTHPQRKARLVKSAPRVMLPQWHLMRFAPAPGTTATHRRESVRINKSKHNGGDNGRRARRQLQRPNNNNHSRGSQQNQQHCRQPAGAALATRVAQYTNYHIFRARRSPARQPTTTRN